MIVFVLIGLGFYVFGYVGYKLAMGFANFIFPAPKESTYTFIDKSVHHHHHEHKNIHIIDEQTKENILNNLN